MSELEAIADVLLTIRRWTDEGLTAQTIWAQLNRNGHCPNWAMVAVIMVRELRKQERREDEERWAA